MATYVFSDIHGHAAPLRRLLERIDPGCDDRFFCLGDLIDRGPEPLAVIELVRALPNVRVLSGNHEDLMLAWYRDPRSPGALADWTFNGGNTTLKAFKSLGKEEQDELIAWMEALPAYAVATVGEQLYALVHAGILPYDGPAREWDGPALEALLAQADPQDLMWVRYEFWENPTGLVGGEGRGPIVIAGHTPSTYLSHMGVLTDRSPIDDDGICRSVHAGDPDACGGVWDKWNIDSGCAGGAGFGRVTIIRLDDGAEFCEDIAKGE